MRHVLILLISAIFSLCTLAACDGSADVPMDSTRLAQIVATVRPSATFTRTPSATPTATPTVTGTPNPAFSATPTPVPLFGDPAAGQALFGNSTRGYQACKTCHRVDSDTRLIGPGLFTLHARAASRESGVSAEDYVRELILDPAAFIVPGFPNLMPKNFARTFSDQELADLMAYIMNLEQ